jgi:hypothetical protein
VISTGAARTFPQDLHNSTGARADRPTPVPVEVGGEHGVSSAAQKSVLCLVTVEVDEAPAPARLSEDPWTAPLTVSIWSRRPEGEAMATSRPERADIPAPADAKR